jgi:predicted phosphodiesterase
MRRIIFTALLLGAGVGLPASLSVTCQAASEIMFPTASQQSAGPTTVALPLKPNSVRFAVIGDSGTGTPAQYELGQEMQKVHQASDFAFVIMLGDNLYGGHSASDYENKFERPYKPLLDEGVLFYASLGNHDNSNEISYAHFNMNGKRYYTFIKGNAQFFVLDSNYMDATQLAWLGDELQKSTSEWKIAYFHHPLYSSGKRHGSDTDLRAVLEPLFKKHKVNIVLSGHDHVYERITPSDSIVYFVLGNSGQLRSGGLEKSSEEKAGYDTDRCFMIVEIAGSELYFQAISRTGQIVDSGLVKQQTATATAADIRLQEPVEKGPVSGIDP